MFTIDDVAEQLEVILSNSFGEETPLQFWQIKGADGIESGVDAGFIKLDDEVGFKFFSSQNRAEENFVIQSYVYKMGLAPEAWGLTAIRVRGVNIYGFFTEVAEVAADRYGITTSVPRYLEKIVEDTRNIIEQMLHAIGISDLDMHLNNWGFIGNRFVVIDFSSSLSDIPLETMRKEIAATA